MSARSSRFIFLLKQYTFKELILLGCGLVLDALSKRIPEYLIRSKNYFDYYHTTSIPASRQGANSIIQFKGLQIILRRDSSDFVVFEQIFLQEELRPVIELIKKHGIDVRYILDCGANIGLTSVYLSTHLPGSSILAVEPEPDNFTYLQKNIEANKVSNIKAVQKGVWVEKAMMEQDEDFCPAKGWAFAVKESRDKTGTIAVDTIENIVKLENFPTIDYIKIDIEGSEFELFRNLNSWGPFFKGIKIVSIEIHEKRGKAVEIENILLDAGFSLFRSGELLIGFKS